MPETDLYAPIKAYLVAQGFDVKGEVGSADLVACRGDEDPLIVELKAAFSLSLVHQGIARQSVTDFVYVAVPRGSGARWAKAFKQNVSLCRRLGLGVITVRPKDDFVEVHADPKTFKPRKVKQRKDRLLREFARRVGDPNEGGATRVGLVTAYRQDALRCASCLARNGPSKGSEVAAETGVATATRLMADDHYGWFERVERGVYALTPNGLTALADYGDPGPVAVEA